MLFTLEVLKAHEGDCLLLHWGTLAEPKLGIIDGGPSDTYETSLRPRLETIRQARAPQLEVEFVMVSHVDNDHIVGVKKLFSDLYGEAQAGVPEANRPLRVRRLWHNTFDDVVGNRLQQHYQQFTASFTADASGELPADSSERIKDGLLERGKAGDAAEAEHFALDISKILAGHPEGRELRDMHVFLRQAGDIGDLNRPFAHQGAATLITAELTPDPLPLAGLNFRIVGPRQAEIDALQAEFDAYLVANGLNTAAAALAAYSDDSIPNLSSIVCMVSMDLQGQSPTMLLTGDARGDKIIAGLRDAGYLSGAADEHLHVDILKVPHHGSDRNVKREFFEKISADVYIVSGDGKHANPDRSTFEWIIESRRPQDDFRIVTTYGIDETDAKRKTWARGPWDPQRDSLAALIAAKRAEGYVFALDSGAPILIELGDERVDWYG